MVTFTVALIALIAGYLIYGTYINKIFGPDDRITPALSKTDGVDFIPLPTWKIFMIQFLNIAGLGPIFGAIMGAQFGTASYLWIVLGTIFAGAVHDFFSGALSIRNGGETLPEMVGRYLGANTKKIMGGFTMILMILVGAVFVSGPAELIAGMTPDYMNEFFWIIIIFLYYILATILPVDKIIAKIYPLFAIALLFMAGGVLVMLYVKNPDLPEMWNGFGVKYEKNPIFPMMFISIACGAISGFHATQSPLMARCMSSERHCRPIFYGAMIAEGAVALIWAAAATYFFQENGIIDQMTGKAYSGAHVATSISKEWLGSIGGIMAILGVVAAPITSGDTALRSARLIAADFLRIDQKPIRKRLLVCIPIFLITMAVLIYSLRDADGFKIIWRYFAWSNQTLSVFTLWAITVYLVQNRKNFYITLLPGLLMTLVCSTYICIAPEGLSLPQEISYIIGGSCTLAGLIWFILWYRKEQNKGCLS
ncbi:MAG: carbon starvation protein A [Bacteroidales bacterium]|nr:carbon starvation protein A [Bacteroidales bacterium]